MQYPEPGPDPSAPPAFSNHQPPSAPAPLAFLLCGHLSQASAVFPQPSVLNQTRHDSDSSNLQTLNYLVTETSARPVPG